MMQEKLRHLFWHILPTQFKVFVTSEGRFLIGFSIFWHLVSIWIEKYLLSLSNFCSVVINCVCNSKKWENMWNLLYNYVAKKKKNTVNGPFFYNMVLLIFVRYRIMKPTFTSYVFKDSTYMDYVFMG